MPRRLFDCWSTCHATGLREWVGNRLADEQLPLGLLADQPYRGQCIELRSGDVLLAATDGILEAAGPSGEEFGLASGRVTTRTMTRAFSRFACIATRRVGATLVATR